MTALRSLQLTEDILQWCAPKYVAMLLPSLAGLKHLTSMCIHNVQSAASLQQHLPPQLQQLRVRLEQGAQTQRIELGHLTALSELQIPCLTGGSKLPVSLQVLELLGDFQCTTVRPLLHLQQLRMLQLGSCAVPPFELQQLRHLQSLKDLRLSSFIVGHSSSNGFNAAAEAWRVLPLHDLYLCWNLGSLSLSLSEVQQLGRCQGLTRLGLSEYIGPVGQPVTVAQLEAALCQLTQLEELSLCSGRLGQVGVAAMGAVPTLRKLSCSSLNDGFPVENLRQTATSITCLILCWCGLSDEAVAAMASSCTALRHLNIAYNAAVADAALSAIAKQLTQLTYLDVEASSVTDVGVVQLSRLTGLQELRVKQTVVSAAAVARALRWNGPA